MTNHCSTIGLRGLGTALPQHWVALEDLPLSSSPETLARVGFTGAYIANGLRDLAAAAARRALEDAGLGPLEIDALIWVSALPQGHQQASAQAADGVLDLFCYSGSWLQEELGLEQASVCGIAQQGCAGMFSALRAARALLVAEPGLEHILCVGADALPVDAVREILYNVISDAACAVVISRHGLRHDWLGFHQLSKGYYWDVPARETEIIAAYFPAARATIQAVLQQTGLRADELDLVIPTGVAAASWPILLRLCGIPADRLYWPQARFGHTIAADSFLYLEEARKRGSLRPGMRVLLFTYGFGSSWSALVLEIGGEKA